MKQIKWKSELKQLEAEIKEIGQYMESNDLPESVINALDIRLDILMSDVSTLRARIRSRRDYDGH